MSTVSEDRNLDLVMDVTVSVTVRLGSTMLPMKDVLALGPGSMIQLDQAANDPVSLYVNEKLVARGEVVVMEERFGIKILELVGSGK